MGATMITRQFDEFERLDHGDRCTASASTQGRELPLLEWKGGGFAMVDGAGGVIDGFMVVRCVRQREPLRVERVAVA